jgi:RNA polymerase sigma-70 factor, ECF subfamily
MNPTERFTLLWTDVQPALRGFLSATLPDFHAAQDVLQDVAIALHRQFEQGKEPDHFLHWALAMARNKVLMHVRTRSRSRLIFDEELIEAAAAEWQELLPELEPRAEALRGCVTRLQGRAAELVRMRYLEALPFEEISRRLNLTSVAARTALKRIRLSLRECIDRQLNATPTP